MEKITLKQLVDYVQITPQVIKFVDNLYSKMMAQIRFSLSKLNNITTVETNRLFNLLQFNPNWLEYIESEYPEGANTVRQPIYNILTILVIKGIVTKQEQFASDTNTLHALIVLGRLKYKMFKRGVDERIFEKTINQLSKKTFIGAHGTVWTVNNIASNVYNMWMPKIIKDFNDTYSRYRYIVDMRNKFNQIIKTVAKHYYNLWEHRNEVDRKDIIAKRTQEILNFINNQSLPYNILQYASSIAKCDTDKINNLHHNIQIYNSMQSQMHIIVTNILDKLLARNNLSKQLYDKPIDINDPDFLKSFINSLKRSTIVLKSVDHEIFTSYGYDRFEVLSYALVTTLYVDSINHYSDYNSTDSNNVSNISIDDGSDGDYSDDYYAESIEALYDGILLNEELIMW